MTTRSMGPLAGFGWLARGISLAFRHPKPVLGGAAFVMVAVMLPSLVTLPFNVNAMATGTPMSPSAFGVLMLVSMLVGLLIVPVYAGYLQLIDAAERGLPARALDVFRPYREGDALRLIGYGLAVMAVYLIVFAVVIAATGGGLVAWYMQVMASQASHMAPPAPPAGFWTAMALFMVLSLFLVGFYAISLGQVALNRRSVVGALGDGFSGALKNLLPLIMLALGIVLAWIGLFIVLMILVVIIVMLGKLAGAWLTFVLLVPMYIALLLGMFTWMFGAMYHQWLDVCGPRRRCRRGSDHHCLIHADRFDAKAAAAAFRVFAARVLRCPSSARNGVPRPCTAEECPCFAHTRSVPSCRPRWRFALPVRRSATCAPTPCAQSAGHVPMPTASAPARPGWPRILLRCVTLRDPIRVRPALCSPSPTATMTAPAACARRCSMRRAIRASSSRWRAARSPSPVAR